jgi:hypothetical protein
LGPATTGAGNRGDRDPDDDHLVQADDSADDSGQPDIWDHVGFDLDARGRAAIIQLSDTDSDQVLDHRGHPRDPERRRGRADRAAVQSRIAVLVGLLKGR